MDGLISSRSYRPMIGAEVPTFPARSCWDSLRCLRCRVTRSPKVIKKCFKCPKNKGQGKVRSLICALQTGKVLSDGNQSLIFVTNRYYPQRENIFCNGNPRDQAAAPERPGAGALRPETRPSRSA